MSDQPRKHHVVPQFYLAGFTDDGTADGNLQVVDTSRLKTWVSKPKDAAHRRDFHEIDGGPSVDPMIVEKTLAQFESRWSVVVRNVVEHQTLPTGEDLDDLMDFVAFMAVRVPSIRNKISDFLDEVRQKEAFARKCLEEQGRQVETSGDDEFAVFDQTWHVGQMLKMAQGLSPLLKQRTWQLRIVEDGAPDLICSDRPVVPVSRLPSIHHPPGFMTPNTVVTIPLNKRMAIVSMLDFDVGHRMIGGTGVAQLNSITGMHAGQLYFPPSDFVWRKRDGTIGNREDLLKDLRNAPA